MKKRNPVIIDRKKRGEWAEMVFMAHATEPGLQVRKPWENREVMTWWWVGRGTLWRCR
jgi:hypothetical protein